MSKKVKVFISSTKKDLNEERDAVHSMISNLTLEPVAFELFGSRTDAPLSVCLQEVRNADIYIGIFGERYGTVEEASGKSFTELEYREARTCKEELKEILIYIKDVPKREEPLENFLKELKKNHFCAPPFKSTQALEEHVKQDIMRILQKTYLRVREIEAESTRLKRSTLIPTPVLVGGKIASVDELIIKAYEQYNYQDCIFHTQKGLQKDPENINLKWLYYASIINMAMDGDRVEPHLLEEGAEFYIQMSKKLPSASQHCFYNAANAYSSLGNREKATKFFKEAINADRNFAEAWKNLGSEYYLLGDVKEALKCFDFALGIDPKLVEGLISKGIVLAQRESRHAEAIELYKKAIEIDPNIDRKMPAVYFNLSYSLLTQGHAKEALVECVKYERLNPTSSKAMHLKARIYQVLWRQDKSYIEDSYAFLKSFVNKKEISPYWWFELGLICWCKAKNAEAKTAFEKAIDAGYQDGSLFDRYGHLLEKEGNLGEAIKYYEKAEKADKAFTYCLGNALLKNNEPKKALHYLKVDAEEINKDDLSWHQLGVCYDKLGDTIKAEESFITAIKLNPRYALAWANLGGIHWRRGDLYKALLCFVCAEKIDDKLSNIGDIKRAILALIEELSMKYLNERDVE